MGDYRGKWNIMVGFKAEMLPAISEIVKKLKAQYPDQGYNIMNSKFKQYDFILVCFADSRDDSHKIGTALVKRELPAEYNLLYWVKEVNLLKYNVKE